MGPVETLRDVTRNYYKQLKREGLNPFDLLGWEALENLWLEIRRSEEAGNDVNMDMRLDRKLHHATKDMVRAALERKAEAIDIENEDDACTQRFEELMHL